MRVLGINAVFHDPAAALVVDGRVVACAEEERFSRRKHGKTPVPFSTWELPEQAARWCLGEGGLEPGELDAIAYSYDPALAMPVNGDVTASAWEPLRTLFAQRAPRFLQTALPGLDPQRVRFVPHHVAHAASAYLASPHRTCSVLVLDGRGEQASHLSGRVVGRHARSARSPASAALARARLRGGHRAPRLPPLVGRVQGDGDGELRRAGAARYLPASDPLPRRGLRDRAGALGRRSPIRSPTARTGPRGTRRSRPACRCACRRCCSSSRPGCTSGPEIASSPWPAASRSTALRTRTSPSTGRSRRSGCSRPRVTRAPRSARRCTSPISSETRSSRCRRAALGPLFSDDAIEFTLRTARVPYERPRRHRLGDGRGARLRRRRRLVPGAQRVRPAGARPPQPARRPSPRGQPRAAERHQGPRAVPPRRTDGARRAGVDDLLGPAAEPVHALHARRAAGVARAHSRRRARRRQCPHPDRRSPQRAARRPHARCGRRAHGSACRGEHELQHRRPPDGGCAARRARVLRLRPDRRAGHRAVPGAARRRDDRCRDPDLRAALARAPPGSAGARKAPFPAR